jgi:hypothetical protein
VSDPLFTLNAWHGNAESGVVQAAKLAGIPKSRHAFAIVDPHQDRSGRVYAALSSEGEARQRVGDYLGDSPWVLACVHPSGCGCRGTMSIAGTTPPVPGTIRG